MPADQSPDRPLPPDDPLNGMRARIDALDAQIQALISERASCAQQIAQLKQAGEGAVRYYRPEREAEVMRKVLSRNRGPLSDEVMARLFREIISACLVLQQPLKIAYFGPAGTFTQAAVHKHFGHSVDTIALSAIGEVFREVEASAAHYGVVPVENSTEGMVSYTLDRFIVSPLRVCGEVELRIHHHLLAKSDDLKTITRVCSHQQSLAQCRSWLDTHLPGVDRLAVNSNAEAARRAGEETGTAAIAASAAAEIYGLKVLAANIEDEPDNTTRFLVIGTQETRSTGNDKTSLLLSAHNRPGALYKLLDPLARNNISMTRIESRPSRRGTWTYVFFVDIEGHAIDSPVASAMAELEQQATLFRVLGSYPRAVL